jgi:hypothetical protein
MHLQIAERVRADPALDERVRCRLDEAWPAFYLGSVAADVQSVTGTPREQTHFYGLPPQPGEGYLKMLDIHPYLADATLLPVAQSVFVSAYSAHLMLDLRWFREVLVPYFITPNWGDHRHRFLVHNTLLTYLDRQALASLPGNAALTLGAAEPDCWLPFAADGDLVRWRDILVEQLRPGAAIQTVEIYAGRLRITPAQFAANLADAQWMEEHVFRNVPLDRVMDMLASAVEETGELIGKYLEKTLC